MGKLRWFSTGFIRVTGCESRLFTQESRRASEAPTRIIPSERFRQTESPMRIINSLGHLWFKGLRFGIEMQAEVILEN